MWNLNVQIIGVLVAYGLQVLLICFELRAVACTDFLRAFSAPPSSANFTLLMQPCDSVGTGSCPTGLPVAGNLQSDGIPAVFPVSSAIKATAGRYWTLEVQTQIPFIEDTTPQATGVSFTAQPPGTSGWSTTKGLCLYVLSTLLLSIQATSAKVLGRHGLNTSVMILFRSFSILLGAVLPVLYHKPANPWGTKCAMLVVRGLCSFTSISLLYTSVQLMPLSDSVVLQFLSPIMVALAAPLLLKELPSRLIWVCVPMCLVGVLLTAQPTVLFGASGTTSISQTGIAVGITQAAFAASHKICIRYLKDEDSHVQLVYLGSVSVVGAVVLCIIAQQWTMPSTALEWLLLVVTGCSAYGSQMSQTIALKMVQASLATAMSYLSVVWGILSGYLVFSEVPNLLSLGGALLVCSCTLVLGLTEHKSAGQQSRWLQQVCTSAQNYSASVWLRYTGEKAIYGRIATEELDPSCISKPEQLR